MGHPLFAVVLIKRAVSAKRLSYLPYCLITFMKECPQKRNGNIYNINSIADKNPPSGNPTPTNRTEGKRPDAGMKANRAGKNTSNILPMPLMASDNERKFPDRMPDIIAIVNIMTNDKGSTPATSGDEENPGAIPARIGQGATLHIKMSTHHISNNTRAITAALLLFCDKGLRLVIR